MIELNKQILWNSNKTGEYNIKIIKNGIQTKRDIIKYEVKSRRKSIFMDVEWFRKLFETKKEHTHTLFKRTQYTNYWFEI